MFAVTMATAFVVRSRVPVFNKLFVGLVQLSPGADYNANAGECSPRYGFRQSSTEFRIPEPDLFELRTIDQLRATLAQYPVTCVRV